MDRNQHAHGARASLPPEELAGHQPEAASAPERAASGIDQSQKDEAPTTGMVRGFGDQGFIQQSEYATAVLVAATTTATQQNPTFSERHDADRKAFATLQAEAALLGFRVDRSAADDGSPTYIVTRWALTRELATLDELDLFVRQVGRRRGV